MIYNLCWDFTSLSCEFVNNQIRVFCACAYEIIRFNIVFNSLFECIKQEKGKYFILFYFIFVKFFLFFFSILLDKKNWFKFQKKILFLFLEYSKNFPIFIQILILYIIGWKIIENSIEIKPPRNPPNMDLKRRLVPR